MGEYMAGLVGESQYQDAIQTVRRGEVIALIHEPENPYDPRAVKAATHAGRTIGYLPRDHWLGRAIIDEAADPLAVIAEVTGGGKGKRSKGIVLAIFTGKEADAMRARAAPLQRLPASRTGGRPTPNAKTSIIFKVIGSLFRFLFR